MMNNLLQKLENTISHYDNVPRADGCYLKNLTIETKRKQAIELGSANGYSAIWIGLGMKGNNGVLHTIEIDPSLAHQCRDNIRLAGLEDFVNCINGSAIDSLMNHAEDIDFLFLDLGAVDMLPAVRIAEEKLTKNAIIALHNLNFERSYKRLFQYLTDKGWLIEKSLPKDSTGLGFFILTKN